MKCAEEQCPAVFSDERVPGEIRKMCREKNYLDPSFIESFIIEQAGTNIMNKVKLVDYGLFLNRLNS